MLVRPLPFRDTAHTLRIRHTFDNPERQYAQRRVDYVFDRTSSST